MALGCGAPDAAAPLLQGLAGYLECHVGGLGELGYQSLASSSMLGALLTGCLTLYVALFGYRLLLMQDVDFRDAVLAALRAGIVLTFALQWTSYEPVVYRVVTQGPQELAGFVLEPEGFAVSTASEAADRLQTAYQTLERLTPSQTPSDRPAAVPINPYAYASVIPPLTPTTPPSQNSAQPPLTAGEGMLLVSALGPSVALQVAAAILLALGPVIAVLALFDPFLGLLEGWLRALGGTLIGGCGLATILALELGFLEGEAAGKIGSTAPPGDLEFIATGAIFGLLALTVMLAAGLVARGFSIPRRGRAYRTITSQRQTFLTASPPAAASRPAPAPASLSSRAQIVADAVVMSSRREQQLTTELGGTRTFFTLRAGTGVETTSASSLRPLGQSFRRSASQRRSASMARRNSL